jgi:copper oxidase (laccase) domain-containing protein
VSVPLLWWDSPGPYEVAFSTRPESVERVDVCTACNAEFFSHRRDGGITGRQGVIGYVA